MTPFAAARQAVAPHDMTGRLPYLRAALERGRRFRIDQLEELATTAAAGSTLPSDEPRNQIAVVLQQAASAALSDIDAALHRLARGVYGKCEQCGTAIHTPGTAGGATDAQTLHRLPTREETRGLQPPVRRRRSPRKPAVISVPATRSAR